MFATVEAVTSAVPSWPDLRWFSALAHHVSPAGSCLPPFITVTGALAARIPDLAAVLPQHRR
jgi:hypothetical protein